MDNAPYIENASQSEKNEFQNDSDTIDSITNQIREATDPQAQQQLRQELSGLAKGQLKKMLTVTDPVIDSSFLDTADLSLPLTADGQGWSESDPRTTHMNAFTENSNYSKVLDRNVKAIQSSSAYSTIIGDVNSLKEKIGFNSDGTYDKNKLASLVDQATQKYIDDNAGNVEKLKNFLNSDTFLSAMKMLFKIGCFVALGVLAGVLLQKLFCSQAKADSYCKVTVNGKISPLNYQASSDPDCQNVTCDYSYMCGSCDSPSQPDQNHTKCCCSAMVDKNISQNPNATYNYYCNSTWDEVNKAANAALSDLSPSNLLSGLKKIGMYLLIGIGVLLGLIVLFYIIKMGFHYLENELDKDEE
jgi:hypothetical protein